MSAQKVQLLQSVKKCHFCAENIWGRWKYCYCKEEEECHCGMYTKTECPMRDKCAEEEEE